MKQSVERSGACCFLRVWSKYRTQSGGSTVSTQYRRLQQSRSREMIRFTENVNVASAMLDISVMALVPVL